MRRSRCVSVGAGALTMLGTLAASPSAPDRVGFPGSYKESFQVLRTVSKKDELQLATVYGNDRAASVTTPTQLPYPYGSVIVMEWRVPLKDPQGRPILDASGNLQGTEVLRLDVMRREKGYGEAYGRDRTGEWEYASYRPDGSTAVASTDAVACARCHVGAGAARDFVFQGRLGPDRAAGR